MRRRRFPRRPIRRRPGMGLPFRRRPIPPKLVEAHRLFEQGEYAQAAELYIELAEKAQTRGIPQAPNLFLRGAAALLEDGHSEEALEMVKKGLGILVARKNWRQLKKVGTITVGRLKSAGQDELAERIRVWLEEQVPDRIKQSDAWRRVAPAARSGRPKLPSTCSQCGGPVNPQEIEWYGDSTPICSYCGAVLDTNE